MPFFSHPDGYYTVHSRQSHLGQLDIGPALCTSRSGWPSPLAGWLSTASPYCLPFTCWTADSQRLSRCLSLHALLLNLVVIYRPHKNFLAPSILTDPVLLCSSSSTKLEPAILGFVHTSALQIFIPQ
jgi:hypothetical protein